jgi:hypothetical protein
LFGPRFQVRNPFAGGQGKLQQLGNHSATDAFPADEFELSELLAPHAATPLRKTALNYRTVSGSDRMKR